MNAQATNRSLHVVNLNDTASGETDRAVVGELTTHFCVEGRAVEDDLNLGRGARSGAATPSTSRASTVASAACSV